MKETLPYKATRMPPSILTFKLLFLTCQRLRFILQFLKEKH